MKWVREKTYLLKCAPNEDTNHPAHIRSISCPYEITVHPWLLNTYPVRFQSGPEVIKVFSCSTQLGMKFLFINLKILTKFWNFFHAQLSWARSAELSMKKVLNFWIFFYFYAHVKFHDQLSWAWKKFYNRCQADLNPCWAHGTKGTFSDVAAQILLWISLKNIKFILLKNWTAERMVSIDYKDIYY